jgi:environmental stress-induced protein Ves
VTRELLVWPSGGDWRIRISVADIGTNGPFSPYPGVQRWFTVIAGGGVDLAFNGIVRRQLPGSEPLCFDGAAPPDCRLVDAPSRDLNLMLRGARGVITRVEEGRAWQPAMAMVGLLTAVAGCCHAADERHDVPAETLVWFQNAPETLVFEAAAPVVGPAGWWIGASLGAD